MRRPSPFSASTLDWRRIRDAFRDVYRWIDAGTRTLELPRATVDADDLIELVKPDGTRYAAPSSDVGGGGGGGAVDSVFGRTGHVVAMPGDYTASDVGLGNVTDDAQLKRAAGDFATFTAKTSTADADIVLIEDSAAAGAKKKVTLANVLPKFDPTQLTPLARWRASNVTIVSGNVDTIVDTGTMAKDMVAVSAARRIALGTDGNGHAYLNFTTGSTGRYAAGVAADWTFLNDDTTVYSVCIIGAVHTSPGANSGQLILNSAGWSSSNRGFIWGVGQLNTGANGTGFEVSVLDAGSYNARLGWRNRDGGGFVSNTPRVWTVNYNRLTSNGDSLLGYSGGPANNVANTLDFWTNRHLTASASVGMRAVSSSAPTHPLTLGSGPNGATGTDIPLTTMRIYEILIFPRNVSGYDQQRLTEWAATQYTFNANSF